MSLLTFIMTGGLCMLENNKILLTELHIGEFLLFTAIFISIVMSEF